MASAAGAELRRVTAAVEVGAVSTTLPMAGGLTGVDAGTEVVFTYTDGAGVALTNLVLGSDLATRPMARLVKVSDKTFVPATVTGNATSGTITLAPVSGLTADTEYYAEVLTGAMLQKVDASLVTSTSGTPTPLTGLRTGVFTIA
jgi:hypothetical protein